MGPLARPFTFYWWKLRNKVTSNSKETEGTACMSGKRKRTWHGKQRGP